MAQCIASTQTENKIDFCYVNKKTNTRSTYAPSKAYIVVCIGDDGIERVTENAKWKKNIALKMSIVII